MWWPSLTFAVLIAGGYAQLYEVPEPRLEAILPSGIRVSIPDSPGVELFAFHGSVNKPLHYLAAGDMSRDILRPKDGRWVFEDLDIKLKPGDVVYYWLYVQVRGRGFQRTNIYWLVESYISDSPGVIPLPQDKYGIPEARVEPLHPRGLRVSIPDSDGLQLFAFHGNINKQMYSLEAGMMSKDILKPKDGRWVFEDPNVTLKKGDVIYYWTYVIRNGLGYRNDNQEYEVDQLIPVYPEEKFTTTSTSTTTTQPIMPITQDTGKPIPTKEPGCCAGIPEGMKEATLPEGLEFKVVVKNGKLEIVPLIPDIDRRSFN